MSKRLIINADDFGLNSTVNKAILELADSGSITSTTILANMVKQPELCLLRNTPVGTGLHVNLIEGYPVSVARDINTLVNKKGFFYPASQLWTRVLAGYVNPQHIKLEIEAQYKMLIESKITVSHADSHQHLHQYPFLGAIICDVLTYLGISKIRYCNPKQYRGLRMLIVKGMGLSTIRNLGPFQHPEGLITFFSAYPAKKYNMLEKEIEKSFQHHSCLEIMTHPASENIPGSYLDRKAEYEFLKNKNDNTLIPGGDIGLISYNQL